MFERKNKVQTLEIEKLKKNLASKNENLDLGTKMFNEIIRKGKSNGDKGYLGESYAMFGLAYLVLANVGASN